MSLVFTSKEDTYPTILQLELQEKITDIMSDRYRGIAVAIYNYHGNLHPHPIVTITGTSKEVRNPVLYAAFKKLLLSDSNIKYKNIDELNDLIKEAIVQEDYEAVLRIQNKIHLLEGDTK